MQIRQLGFILEIIRKELRWTKWNFKSHYLRAHVPKERMEFSPDTLAQYYYCKTELIL